MGLFMLNDLDLDKVFVNTRLVASIHSTKYGTVVIMESGREYLTSEPIDSVRSRLSGAM